MTDVALEPPLTPQQARLRTIETWLKRASLVVALAIPVGVVCAILWDAGNVVVAFMSLLAVWTLGFIAYAVVAASPYVRFAPRTILLSLLPLPIPVLFLFHKDGFVIVIGFLLLMLWLTLVAGMLAYSIWKTHAAMHPPAAPASAPPEPLA